jgi:GT2 family glycosyltransferase
VSWSTAIVILNWNGWQDTRRCIDSLLADGVAVDQLVVVDNGSEDDSADRIAEAYPDIELLRLGENLGYAGGNNRGVEAALAAGREVIVVLNNDTEVRPGFLAPLTSELARSPDAYVSPRIVYADEPDRAWFGMATVDAKRGIIVHRDEATLTPGERAAEVRATPSITGCCIAAMRDTWLRVGLFDEDYFLIFEDVDWCARANDAGRHGLVVTKSTVAHAVSSSFTRSGVAVSDYYYARNGLRYIRRHHADWWRVSLGFLDAMLRESVRIALRDDHALGAARVVNQLAGVRDHVLGRTGARRPRLRLRR